jgi:hypothetical protein
VQLWLTAAETDGTVVRVALLSTAVEHARTSGDPALLERATAALQRLRLDSLGLMTISAEIAPHTGAAERMLHDISTAEDWRVALKHFAIFGPATGELDRNRQQQAELAQQFVFSRLFPPIQLGGDNLPRFEAKTLEEQDEYHLVKHEQHVLSMFAPVILEALVRVIARHPIPAITELTDHFCSNPQVPPDLGAAIARAFARFWAGDAEAAAFTIAPRIETLARNLLIASDMGIYRTQRRQSPGQYPGLKVLLDKLLQLGLDPSWHRYIVVVCAHPVGHNLRNEIAHGFVPDISDTGAALLLQAAAHLATLVPAPPGQAEPVAQDLA